MDEVFNLLQTYNTAEVIVSLDNPNISKDNLYKGLSTFAVEMMELKNIFNRANEQSLILGDEVSQGTETESGLAIVSGAILKLLELKSTFIFATHLYQFKNIETLHTIPELIFLHHGYYFSQKCV